MLKRKSLQHPSSSQEPIEIGEEEEVNVATKDAKLKQNVSTTQVILKSFFENIEGSTLENNPYVKIAQDYLNFNCNLDTRKVSNFIHLQY